MSSKVVRSLREPKIRLPSQSGQRLQQPPLLVRQAIATLTLLLFVASVSAAPPAYRILRRSESPGKHHQPGHPDAVMVESRARGYAYGYFGVAPRSHTSRSFGYYRTYTQWSLW